jgi:asparagine synthase (glutamine-hydrolysing)
MKLLVYRGHIRNHKALEAELGIEKVLPRRRREEEIILAAYKKGQERTTIWIYAQFA